LVRFEEKSFQKEKIILKLLNMQPFFVFWPNLRRNEAKKKARPNKL
jgi:hypothetical protein